MFLFARYYHLTLGTALASMLTAVSPPTVSARAAFEDEATVVDRSWVKESEFAADLSLHAVETQTIILHLEDDSRTRGRFATNTVRLLVEEAREFSFCIPEGHPHLTKIALREIDSRGKGRGLTKLDSRQGDCKPAQLEPGRYELTVYHDARSVPEGGKLAFVSEPAAPSLLGTDASSANPSTMAFTADNGLWVTGEPGGDSRVLTASKDSISDSEIWVVQRLQGTSGYYFFQDGVGSGVQVDLVEAFDDPNQFVRLRAVPQTPSPQTVELVFNQLGGWDFTLTGWARARPGGSTSVYAAVVVNAGSEQLLFGSSDTGTTFTATWKVFECTDGCDADNLPLAAGEVALFSECNYTGIGAATITSLETFAAFDVPSQGGQPQPQTVRSVRVGPGTFLETYTGTGFSGTVEGYQSDQSCLPAGTTVSSLIVLQDARTYTIDTGKCIACTLNGVDLSGFDFTNGTFTDTNFNGANLQGTRFSGASMQGVAMSNAELTNADFDGADLSRAVVQNAVMIDASFQGADLTSADIRVAAAANLAGSNFADAILNCTSFSGSDLTQTTFGTNPRIQTDFSCRLVLNGATLDYDLFPITDWRYLDLSNSTVTNVPDVLSTIADPLDLSGSILTNVKWLEGKTLDGVNLGCYAGPPAAPDACPAPNGASVCSVAKQIQLQNASLRKACFENASLEGASFLSANLDLADMNGAVFKADPDLAGRVATLDGAFMRGVNLSNADLTGVNAQNVNFYTVSAGTALANGVTAPGANFSGAYMVGADFSGQTTILQSTIWTGAMLINTNFSQSDLTTNTSGGVNSGTNSTFEGAYMHGSNFEDTRLEDVSFFNTYWDAVGAGGEFHLLIPKNNLGFSGYWKDLELPECPPEVKWVSGLTPPLNTNDSNTCPNGDNSNCDASWGSPNQDISLALYKSAVPPAFPQDPTVAAANQCSNSFGDPNPKDYCWITTDNPSSCLENL